MRTTDIAPVTKPVFKYVKVSIELAEGLAIIRSKPGESSEVDMRVPVEMVRKRFSKDETKAFFRAQIKSTVGALEIGDRIEGW